MDTQLATDLLDLPFIREGEMSLATRNLPRGQTFLLPTSEKIAEAMERPDQAIERVADEARNVAELVADLSSGILLWYYILTEAEEIGRENEPGSFHVGEGFGPVGAQIVAETLHGLIELDDRFYLIQNRNREPLR